MKTNLKTIALIGLTCIAALSSCKKDDDLVTVPPPVANEGEIITTMTLLFTDPTGNQPDVTATFRDPDGDGGLSFDIFDTIRLQNNTVYNVSILLLNETVNPAVGAVVTVTVWVETTVPQALVALMVTVKVPSVW